MGSRFSRHDDSWKSELKRLTYHAPVHLHQTCESHVDEVYNVCFSKSGKYIATCGLDGNVKVRYTPYHAIHRQLHNALLAVNSSKCLTYKITHFLNLLNSPIIPPPPPYPERKSWIQKICSRVQRDSWVRQGGPRHIVVNYFIFDFFGTLSCTIFFLNYGYGS